MYTRLISLAYVTSLAQSVVSAQWGSVVPIENRTLDEIYTAAEAEHGISLRVAVGGDAKQQWASTIEAFGERVPRVTLNMTIDLSKYHDSRIDRGFYTGNDPYDVALLQTLQDFPRWKAHNRLLLYKPQNFSDIINGEKDFEGAWLPTFLFNFGQFIYDTDKVNESGVPVTYQDLLDPKWKGRLILTYPNDDDAIDYLFSIIMSKYGFEWLENLAQQEVQWVRGTATPQILMAQTANDTSSQRAITFSSMYMDGLSSSLQSKMPVGEEYMSWFQTTGIFKSTQCPETAKLFVSWLLSDEVQGPVASAASTALNHLNEQSGHQVFTSNNTQTQGFREFMLDRANVEWWRLQYETTLGPPVGPDPDTLY